MRKLPADLPFPPQERERGELKSITSKKYAFITMTPMFGGGEETKKVDKLRPVRAPSVRGALREWWRVLNRYDKKGARLSDEELYRRECLIWGGVAFKKSRDTSEQQALLSAVRVDVGEWHDLRTIQIAEWKISPKSGKGRWQIKSQYPPYAVWPFQGESENGQQKAAPDEALDEGFQFVVTIGYDLEQIEKNLVFGGVSANEVEHQVKAALTAWANFGGVGSRSRRGLGALWCEDLAFDDEAALKHFVDVVPEIRACLLGAPCNDAGGAWKDALNPLREFRQGEGIGRNEGPGRSFWPEPSEIRTATNNHHRWHSKRIPATEGVDGFPRANFGMPIIFRFVGDPQEPPPTMLLPLVDVHDTEPANRMASPLILRPIRFKKGEIRSLALFFPVPRYEGLWLKGADKNVEKAGHDRKVANDDSPLQGFYPDQALEAFESYLCERRGTGESGRFHRVKTFSVEGGGA